jgi:putative oxidoreductase
LLFLLLLMEEDKPPMVSVTLHHFLESIRTELGPYAELLLRAYAGLVFIPHALRIGFGYFTPAGRDPSNVGSFAGQLDRAGYSPGWLWARLIMAVKLVGGPLLALGLLTQAAAFAAFCFLVVCNIQRWKAGGFFWDEKGLEYTLMWTLVALYFTVNGAGAISLDHALRITG